MRSAVLVGITAVVVGAGVALPAGVTSAATTPTDLYVYDDQGTANATCSDAGPGSQAQPFCTIQAAANVVQPGQTVHVDAPNLGSLLRFNYPGEVDITRSGTPDTPITFVADASNAGGTGIEVNAGGTHAFTVTGAHDVVIRGFSTSATSEAFLVTDSSQVTIDRNWINGANQTATPSAGVSVAGQSSGVTISRNFLTSWGLAGVSVGQGVSSATVTTNTVADGIGSGIMVTGSPGAAVTSNTIFDTCRSGIAVTGASTGTSVENNVVDRAPALGVSGTTCPAPGDAAGISVTADSIQQTNADYNLLYEQNNNLYNWAGTLYGTTSAFQSATGQGGHDLNKAAGFDSKLRPTENSAQIDSADANAPGELSTDADGNPRVDDPLVANSGTGSGFVDRGAYEYQDPYALTGISASPNQGPYPLPVTATATVSNPWSTPVSYSWNFGDGSAPVTTSALSASHTYSGPTTKGQQYPISVTATLPTTSRRPSSGTAVTVNPPAPLVPALKVSQSAPESPGTVLADAGGSTDSWAITSYSFTWGDGSPAVQTASSSANHDYAAPGTYTVTVTEQDNGGNTASVSRQVVVGSPYVPVAPTRILDTRNGTGAPVAQVGPDGTLSLQVTGTNGVPATGVTAVVLNVTVTDPTMSSFLSVYPDGTPRPISSNLNYLAGETIPNLVTVPVGADGKVDLYNHTGSVDIVADVEGFYRFAEIPEGANAAYHAGYLISQAPTRLLDTRNGTGAPTAPLGAGTPLALQVAGMAGVPFGVDAVVLNVTVAEPSTSSFLTVYPDGTALPNASNLNYTAGEVVSNAVIVPVGPNGEVDFLNHYGSVDVIADLQGYYSSGAGGAFTPVSPARLLDTRNGTGAPTAPVGQGSTLALPVTGVAGIPADATAAALNVTVTDPSMDSFITVHPDGTALPTASNVNFSAGETIPNLVTAHIGPDGKVDFYNHMGTVDLVVDVFGYFTG